MHQITRRTIRTIDELHFTGGLRGNRREGGWQIGPLLRDGNLVDMATVADEQIQAVAEDFGVRVFAADETTFEDPDLPIRIWRPFVGLDPDRELPTETWANIAHHAMDASDQEYSSFARYVAVCLRASNIRLRDISDGYGAQLRSALNNKTEIGHPFENIPLDNIYLAIHSFVAEMGAARDHLATIVGRQLGAPSNKDSLARLFDWLDADARREQAAHPAAKSLISGWTDQDDPWLRQLTDYRNLFLHRVPMGARGFEAAPRLIARESRHGEIRTLALPIPRQLDYDEAVDALVQFIRLHWQLFHLAAELAGMSRYPATPRIITRKDLDL